MVLFLNEVFLTITVSLLYCTRAPTPVPSPRQRMSGHSAPVLSHSIYDYAAIAMVRVRFIVIEFGLELGLGSGLGLARVWVKVEPPWDS